MPAMNFIAAAVAACEGRNKDQEGDCTYVLESSCMKLANRQTGGQLTFAVC